jgi:YidC/Oxa1 family membrane protein insertase
MIPMGVKSQKSMVKMQKLNPELEKIRAKYGNSKDPEIMRKMQAEQQALYSKNKVNPLGGCLPMLITMPLFFGLSYIMNQSYLYVTKLNHTYTNIAVSVQSVPHYTDYVVPLALPHIPKKTLELPNDDPKKINISNPAHLAKILNKFSESDWENLLTKSPKDYSPAEAVQAKSYEELPPLEAMPEFYGPIADDLALKRDIEVFFGLRLTEPSGWSWPGILIPVLVALTTFSSSWIMSKMQTSSDKNAKTQQKVMMYAMPVMMVFMTVGLPAGVGIYWTTSSVFQTVQQAVMNKRAGYRLFPAKKGEITVE